MIKFEDVTIQYTKDFYCLLEFNKTLNSNTLFVGDFYSGANSIMRIISKIDKHYSGVVTIDDVDIKIIKDKDLSVAYLPENPVLFKFKNVFNNIYFSLKIRKINKKTAKNTINSIKNEFNLKFFEKPIKNLNISEKKIICLTRALLWKSKILLLENFFEILDEEYTKIACKLIDKFAPSTLIVACEKSLPTTQLFNNFEIVNLEQ